MVVSAIVLIGPAPVLPVLLKQLEAYPQIQSFTEHEVREAVEYIATARPSVVAIDEEFAVSTRGEALIGRISDDPDLVNCDIRILPREPRHESSAIKPAVAAVQAADGSPLITMPQLDRHGTRRAERVRLIEGVAVTVDGSPAQLIDLSTCGAQVISRMVLRPNQRVRLALPEGTRALRCGGAVVWASFEMPAGQPPRYRAGLKITGIEGDILQDFADRHRAPTSAETG